MYGVRGAGLHNVGRLTRALLGNSPGDITLSFNTFRRRSPWLLTVRWNQMCPDWFFTIYLTSAINLSSFFLDNLVPYREFDSQMGQRYVLNGKWTAFIKSFSNQSPLRVFYNYCQNIHTHTHTPTAVSTLQGDSQLISHCDPVPKKMLKEYCI